MYRTTFLLLLIAGAGCNPDLLDTDDLGRPTGTLTAPTVPTTEPSTTTTLCADGLPPSTWYADKDGDTWGDDNDTVLACDPPLGFIDIGGDCNDDSDLAAPGLTEVTCDGLDNDCDGVTEDDPDGDQDGYGICTDCNDGDVTVNPGATEIPCDGIENDCDLLTADDPDEDLDGWSICNGDCNDQNVAQNPGRPELECDFADNDCDPSTPDGQDLDGDGFDFCVDCDDSRPDVFPGAAETICDGVDNDCDAVTADDPDNDGDGDGFCSGDCDDGDPTVGPSQTETFCDGIDNDCRANTRDDPDADADGVSVCSGDCDDTRSQISPLRTEVTCDGLDNDCDAATEDDPDNDLDGFGSCFEDCDDGASFIYPGAPEIIGDGLDFDCDGTDLSSMFDDFETGAVDPTVFVLLTGDADVQSVEVADGNFALRLGGGGSEAVTAAFPTQLCTQVEVLFDGQRGPETPDTGDNVNFEYWDGTGWRNFYVWEGINITEADFSPYRLTITAASALNPNFQVRMLSNGSGAGFDEFYVDNFRVACDLQDTDGDGYLDIEDCDPLSPNHWSDCGVCQDMDGDDFGTGCDLGTDCDDGDATAFPGNPDLIADGIDQNCDGIDGPPLLFDNFDTGNFDPLTFASVTGDYVIDSLYFYSGAYSLKLGGGVGIATTVGVDATGCTAVTWAYQGKRGPELPDSTDVLFLDWFTPLGSGNLESWYGGATDPTFVVRQGLITNPNALTSNLVFEFRSVGTGINFDHYYVDDFVVGCL